VGAALPAPPTAAGTAADAVLGASGVGAFAPPALDVPLSISSLGDSSNELQQDSYVAMLFDRMP
jgi:hypothetical protein